MTDPNPTPIQPESTPAPFAAPDPGYGASVTLPGDPSVTHNPVWPVYPPVYPPTPDPGAYPPAYPSSYPPAYTPAYPPAATPGYGGYGGYGGQPPAGYVMYAAAPKTNNMAIAAMVVSIVGAALLFCYGVGGLVGIVGAILGHVARRQIRQRNEGGAGMALAGIITGWIAFGLGLAIMILFGIVIATAVNNAQ